MKKKLKYIKYMFFAISILTFLFYLNILNLKQAKTHISSLRMGQNINQEAYILNNTGCFIPNYALILKSFEPENTNKSCGKREVFIKKLTKHKIQFYIDKKLRKPHIQCFYTFANRPIDNDERLDYLEYKKFDHETLTYLINEVIHVKCTDIHLKNKILYTDNYIILKEKIDYQKSESKTKWNILIFGMDTMSRDRIYRTMPKTIEYLKTNKWLDFKGYNKIAFNTYPNLMALLSGENYTVIEKECNLPAKVLNMTMSVCNHKMLWSKYKMNGYITGYGEDQLKSPDTFTSCKGFRTSPTHHYMRPFFLLGETSVGNIICAGKLPSTLQMMQYTKEFALTYRNRGFFGLFWSNSYSHNPPSLPTLLDNDVVKFFKKLEDSGILENTFVIFVGDHGTRYGRERIDYIESYYAERLPMLFMKVPTQFQTDHKVYYDNMLTNQNRLITPYDLHKTLFHILLLFNDSLKEAGCGAGSKCMSLFEEISELRTCSEALVPTKWCACFNFKKTPSSHMLNSIESLTKILQNRIKTAKTKKCYACKMLSVDKILRTHSYRTGNSTYYVVTYSTKPTMNIYESLLRTYDEIKFEIIGPNSLIVSYAGNSACVVGDDKNYCVCHAINGKSCPKVM